MKRAAFVLAISAFLLLLSLNSLAAQVNSTSYKQNVIVSAGGENTASSSYKTNTAVGIINGIISSASYINKLGFFHTWLLANGQPCSSASQCEGGFCCDGLCRSSACPTQEAGAGGGGVAAVGGGGAGPLPLEPKEIKDFSVSPGSIEEEVPLGETKTKTISVKNTGDAELDLSLDVLAVEDFVSLSESSFSLQPGQEKIVEAGIIGKKLGSYLGEINVKAGGIEKSVSLVINVESKEALFDVKIDIPLAYKEVGIGDELKAQITLLNVGPSKKVDVTTTYVIKDRKGAVPYESSETFAVENQKSYVKSFKITDSFKPGDHLAVVELRYQDSFAVSSELFKVTDKKAEFIMSAGLSAMIFAVFSGFVFLLAYLLLPRTNFFQRLKGKRK